MKNVSLRPIAPGDIPEVVRMIRELSAFHGETGTVSVETVTRDTRGPRPWWHVFVAEKDGALVGYLVLLPKSKVADGERGIDLDHLYVRAPHREMGIGRAFIALAATHARANACTYLTIATAPDNTAAQTAYEACGFTRLSDTSSPRFRIDI